MTIFDEPIKYNAMEKVVEFTDEFKKVTRNQNIKCKLAVLYGISFVTIERWLNGKNHGKLLSLEYMKELCKITGIPQDKIIK